MKEEIAFGVDDTDGAVGSPSDDGFEPNPFEAEGSVGVVGYGIAHTMGVSGGVCEDIGIALAMYPGCLKEMMEVFGEHTVAVLIEDNDLAWFLVELEHISGHTCHTWTDAGFSAFGQDGVFDEFVVLVALELSAPYTAEVAIYLSVIVFKDAGVDAVRAAYGIGFRDEGSFGVVCDRYTEAEDTAFVFGAEDEVVPSVFLYDIVIPELFGCPGDVREVKDLSAVNGLWLVDGVHAEDMVVAHAKMVSVIILGVSTVDVMGGIDVDGAVEDMGRWVSHVSVGIKIPTAIYHFVIYHLVIYFIIVLFSQLCIYLIHTFIGEFIFRDDEHGEDEKECGYDADEPEDSLFGERCLVEFVVLVESGEREDESGHYPTESHTGFVEDAGERIDDACYSFSGGIFAIGDDFGNECPHISGSDDNTRGLDELGEVYEPQLRTERRYDRDEIEESHTEDRDGEEDEEHIPFTDTFFDSRHEGHEDEGGDRAESHEEGHIAARSVDVIDHVVRSG